ncbi:hypothetical protein JJR79_003536 [Salmonella enterica]|nr:hypothetical protein [Salmonella enterica]
MSRKKYDANLPRYLTYRKASKSFFWRNPVTNKEFPLGQIARRDAITGHRGKQLHSAKPHASGAY